MINWGTHDAKGVGCLWMTCQPNLLTNGEEYADILFVNDFRNKKSKLSFN